MSSGSPDMTLGWQEVYGYRHLVVTTPAGRWAVCNLEDAGEARGLPCTTCLKALVELNDTTFAPLVQA